MRMNKLLETVGELKGRGLSEGTVIELKNLGMQFAYRWLFLIEYGGPPAIMALIAMQPAWVYGQSPRNGLSPATQIAVWAYILHFVKRELETLFLHKFSKPSVPLSVIVRNSVYYWGIAVLLAYFICAPGSQAVTSMAVTQVCAAGMAVCQLGNFAVHLWFAMQRKGDKDASRPIPAGPLFFVSCPNYFFEVVNWVFFAVMVNNHPVAWVFAVLGLYQMALWAKGKHKAYVKQEKKEGLPPVAQRRSAMIPFLW